MTHFIGSGIDTLTNEPRNLAVAIPENQIKQNQPYVKPEIQSKVFYSKSDMAKNFEGSLSVNLQKPDVGVDESVKVSDEKKAYDLYYVLRMVETVEKDELVPPYAFKSGDVESKKFNNNSDGFYRFHGEFGDSFISSIVRGRELSVIIKYQLNSREEQKELKSKLESNTGPVAVNADLAAALKNSSQNVQYTIQIHAAGYKLPAPNLLGSFDDLSKYLNNLNDPKNQADPVPIRYEKLSYSTISSDPLMRDMLSSIETAKELNAAVAKCKEAINAALYCFEFEDEIGISDEELVHDQYYKAQKKHKDDLEYMLKELEEIRERLPKKKFEKDEILKHKKTINEIIIDLNKVYEFIEQGGVNAALVKWIPGTDIRYVKHKNDWTHDFSFKIPELTKKLRFRIEDDNETGENNIYKKEGKLKFHQIHQGKLHYTSCHTIFNKFTNNKEYEVPKIDEQMSCYIKPTPNDQQNPSNDPADFSVGIYAVRFFSKPSKKLIPKQIATGDFTPRQRG